MQVKCLEGEVSNEHDLEMQNGDRIMHTEINTGWWWGGCPGRNRRVRRKGPRTELRSVGGRGKKSQLTQKATEEENRTSRARGESSEKAESSGTAIGFLGKLHYQAALGKKGEEAVEFIDPWWAERTDCWVLGCEGMVRAESQ